MKLILSNAVGIAAVVACLALGFNRPANAEEQVKEEVQKQTQVIVVRAEGDGDIADAVKKLKEQLKGLPQEVQEQIKHQLQGIKPHQPLKIQAVSDHEVKSAHKPDGDKRAIAIAVTVDGDEVSAKDVSKAITVKVENGQVILNGKPIAKLKEAGHKEIRVMAKVAGDTDAGKAAHRKMVFVGQDGEVREFKFDVDVDAKHVEHGTTDDAKEIKGDPHVTVVRQQHQDKVGSQPKHEIHVQTQKLGGYKLISPGHAVVAAGGAHADKTHLEVTKRLKGIESELKKIRKLLEKMQDQDGHQEEHEDED